MLVQLPRSGHAALQEACAWGRNAAYALPLAIFAALVTALVTGAVCPPVSGWGPWAVHVPIVDVWNTPDPWDWEGGPLSLAEKWSYFEEHIGDLGIRKQIIIWISILIDAFVADWLIAIYFVRKWCSRYGYYYVTQSYIIAFIIPSVVVLTISYQFYQLRMIEHETPLYELYLNCDVLNPCGENK